MGEPRTVLTGGRRRRVLDVEAALVASVVALGLAVIFLMGAVLVWILAA